MWKKSHKSVKRETKHGSLLLYNLLTVHYQRLFLNLGTEVKLYCFIFLKQRKQAEENVWAYVDMRNIVFRGNGLLLIRRETSNQQSKYTSICKGKLSSKSLLQCSTC